MASDRDDDDTGLVQDLLWRDDDSVELLRLPHDGRPPGSDAWRYVQDLIHVPAVVPPDATAETGDDLRTAARKKLAAAGLYGDALAPISFVPTPDSTTDRHEYSRLRSWKLPARMQAGSSIYDNLAPSGASAPQAEAGNADATASAAASPETSTFDNAPDGVARAPAPFPLDHPDARTGLALTAADTLLRRGVEAVAELAGGNRPLLQQIVESAVAWLGSALPPEYKPSAAKTGEAALADADRRIDERDRATRTRAALGTLAGRRSEAEHEHAEAVVAGDRAKTADARREAVDAWRAERRARGDGEAEINAGARALEAQHRKTALRHRLAQMDEAGIERALDEDNDAKTDPAAARAAAETIVRTRRLDPARAGQASIEREIEQRKRDGRIDTPAEETAARYKLRLEAQAERGIAEEDRRILTSDERTMLATEYHQVESTHSNAAANAWLNGEAQKAGPHAERFKLEVAPPSRPNALTALDGLLDRPQLGEEEGGRVEPAQSKKSDNTPDVSPDSSSPRGFGQEAIAEMRRRLPSGPIPSEVKLDVVAETAIRLKELPSNAALYMVGAMAGANPDSVRFAAAHAIARIARDAPEIAARSFEPWVMETAARIVRLEQVLLQHLDPDDSAYSEKRRDILRRVHLETGYILPPDFAAFVAAGAGALAARRAKQIGKNADRGAKAQDRGVQRLRADLEPYGFTVTGVKQVQTKFGRTDPDSTIRTKSDHIEFVAEVKVPTARFKRKQREKQESLENAFLFRVHPKTGVTEVFRVSPSTESYARGTGTPYEEWLASFLNRRRRK